VSAVLDQLETAVVAAIAGLGLTLGSTSVTVSRKKLVRLGEGLDTTPLITVAVANQAGKDEWWQTAGQGMKGKKRREYVLEVDLAAKGQRDAVANEGTYQLWREKIMSAFEPLSSLGVAQLYDVLVEPGPSYDREHYPLNLDNSRLFLRLVTIEDASLT
jgi:hypothetical protein